MADLNKMYKRAVNSKKKNMEKVKQDTIRAVGTQEVARRAAADKQTAANAQENKSNNDVIRTLNVQINQTKEGSNEEKALTKRRNALRRALYTRQ